MRCCEAHVPVKYLDLHMFKTTIYQVVQTDRRQTDRHHRSTDRRTDIIVVQTDMRHADRHHLSLGRNVLASTMYALIVVNPILRVNEFPNLLHNVSFCFPKHFSNGFVAQKTYFCCYMSKTSTPLHVHEWYVCRVSSLRVCVVQWLWICEYGVWVLVYLDLGTSTPLRCQDCNALVVTCKFLFDVYPLPTQNRHHFVHVCMSQCLWICTRM